jgi:hypothetical protein
MCSYCNYGIASTKVCCGFLRAFSLFSYLWTYFVVYGFSRTIRTMSASFVVYGEFGCLCLVSRSLKWV